MKEIVDRLTENRNIEKAKSILESAGYKVTKKSERLEESKMYQMFLDDAEDVDFLKSLGFNVTMTGKSYPNPVAVVKGTEDTLKRYADELGMDIAEIADQFDEVNESDEPSVTEGKRVKVKKGTMNYLKAYGSDYPLTIKDRIKLHKDLNKIVKSNKNIKILFDHYADLPDIDWKYCTVEYDWETWVDYNAFSNRVDSNNEDKIPELQQVLEYLNKFKEAHARNN